MARACCVVGREEETIRCPHPRWGYLRREAVGLFFGGHHDGLEPLPLDVVEVVAFDRAFDQAELGDYISKGRLEAEESVRSEKLDAPVAPTRALGWDGDAFALADPGFAARVRRRVTGKRAVAHREPGSPDRHDIGSPGGPDEEDVRHRLHGFWNNGFWNCTCWILPQNACFEVLVFDKCAMICCKSLCLLPIVGLSCVNFAQPMHLGW